jgi:hypothetical protein
VTLVSLFPSPFLTSRRHHGFVLEPDSLTESMQPRALSTTAGQDNENVMLGVEKVVDQQAVESSLRPPPIPLWGTAFNEWFQGQGSDDPIFLGPGWAQLFGEWLQPLWPLLHNQGLRDPVTDRSRWVRLFALWLKGLLAFHAQSPSPVNPATTLTSPSETHLIPQASSSTTTPALRQHRKHTRNMISRRTAAEIRQACIGGEPGAVNSITRVFLPDYHVSREDLKQKPGSSTQNHWNYMALVGLRGSRYYCRLCGAGSSDWKNDKDLLDHTWNTHFDI